LRLFKAACLNYRSNPVVYEGETIERARVIHIQNTLAKKLKNVGDQTNTKQTITLDVQK
jgi:hypothetical protein